MNSERACHLSEERVRIARKGIIFVPDVYGFFLFLFLSISLIWGAIQAVRHLFFAVPNHDNNFPSSHFEFGFGVAIYLVVTFMCVVIGVKISDETVTPRNSLVRLIVRLCILSGCINVIYLLVSWFGMSGGES